MRLIQPLEHLTKTHTKLLSTLFVFIFVLSGCVIHQPARPDDPYYAPAMTTIPPVIAAQDGSLYSPNSSLDLFGDRKARQIGDILAVVLEERTTSSKTSSSEITKENEITSNAGPLLGATPSLGEFGLNSNITSEREFTGEAEADQSNRLNGSISVTVVGKYPNGTLVIRGEKWMKLNRGDEYIRISGLVRPDDISPDNTVMSTKIANARIAYSGEGELADSQKMGWLTRFFNGPVWPF